jgi:hypothetical protein
VDFSCGYTVGTGGWARWEFPAEDAGVEGFGAGGVEDRDFCPAYGAGLERSQYSAMGPEGWEWGEGNVDGDEG